MTPVVWLASYPRSGNTMLRVVLAQCFALPSAAIYPEDFGGNAKLQALTGRLAPTADGVLDFGDVTVRVLKTHSPPQDAGKAIYIVRNGIDAVASFHDHSGVPIDTLIRGRRGLPTWAAHVESWRPDRRPKTLLLRYEDVVADMAGTVDRIASFLDLAPRARTIPSREELAAVDGKWIRSASASHRTKLTTEEVEQFWRSNGQTMDAYGYSRQHVEHSCMLNLRRRA